MELLKGTEPFTNGCEELYLTVLDYWSFQYSNIAQDPEYVAEFLVAKALRIEEPTNRDSWTLWDIDYEGLRIEVKETSYWHPFNQEGKVSARRSFGIKKIKGNSDIAVRNNDIYVFCLLKGENKEDASPLDISHWEFYVVPTSVVDERFGDQATVALSRIRDITSSVSFEHLKKAVDAAVMDVRLSRRG